jgi:hypothetical protein
MKSTKEDAGAGGVKSHVSCQQSQQHARFPHQKTPQAGLHVTISLHLRGSCSCLVSSLLKPWQQMRSELKELCSYLMPAWQRATSFKMVPYGLCPLLPTSVSCTGVGTPALVHGTQTLRKVWLRGAPLRQRMNL